MIVLWDLDGTIIDSGPEILQRIRRVISELGYEVPDLATQRRFIGPPLLDSFLGLMTPDDAAKAVLRSREIAQSQSPDYLVEIHDDVAELVRDLHAKGVQQAVASSKGQWLVELVIEHFKLTECFDIIVGSDQDRSEKSLVIAKALTHFDTPGDAIMVGDRIHDLEGAQAHGIPAIIVGWGYGDGEEIPGALAKVDTVAQLRSMLEA